jgi:hypothetical protein
MGAPSRSRPWAGGGLSPPPPLPPLPSRRRSSSVAWLGGGGISGGSSMARLDVICHNHSGSSSESSTVILLLLEIHHHGTAAPPAPTNGCAWCKSSLILSLFCGLASHLIPGWCCILSFAAIAAQLLYAAPSDLVCSISIYRPYKSCASVAARRTLISRLVRAPGLRCGMCAWGSRLRDSCCCRYRSPCTTTAKRDTQPIAPCPTTAKRDTQPRVGCV